MSLSLASNFSNPNVDFATVCRLLGVNQRSVQWQLRYVAALIAHEHFPEPLPQLRGERLSRSISARFSRWQRQAVEAWLYGRIPPHLADQVDQEEARAAAARMDARAEGLVA